MKHNIAELRYFWGLLEESRRVETGEEVLKYGSEIHRHKTDFLVINENGPITEIVCTGSTEAREWITNLNAFPKNGFHAGFYNVARGFKRILERRGMRDTLTRVICHSRGIYGLILAYMLKEQSGVIGDIEVISFGAPEPCKPSGVSKLAQAEIGHHRVITKADFVRLLGLGRHYETELTICPNVPASFDHTNYGKALNLLESEEIGKGLLVQ